MSRGRRLRHLLLILGIAIVAAAAQSCASTATRGTGNEFVYSEVPPPNIPPAPMVASMLAPRPADTLAFQDAAAASSAGTAAIVLPAGGDGRKVVYTGRLRLKVANRETAHAALAGIISGHRGYIQHDTGDAIVFRVPPDEFDAAMREAQGLGETAAREVTSQDVTEAYTDLNLRIGVAEDALKRLQALMDKAGKLEDLLQVENQIRKLTEEIETMKGKQRFMANQIELSTITVELVQRIDQAVALPRRIEPRFEWLAGIGIDGELAPVGTDARIKGSGNPVVKWILGPRFRLAAEKGRLAPDGFAELAWDGERLIAATPEDWRIRATLVDVRQNASLEFWGDALKEELATNRGYLTTKIEAAALTDAKLDGMVLRFRTAYGGEDWNYDVWLIQRTGAPKELLIVEFARTEKAPAELMKKVEAAVAGIQFRSELLGM